MENKSGIAPIEYKCLIFPAEVEAKTKGGIFLPDDHKDREQFAQMQGTLVAVSVHAFTYENWDGAPEAKPKPGDKVLFAKFAGAVVEGKDGKKYRLLNDKDISAVLN